MNFPYVGIIQIRLRVKAKQPTLSRIFPAPLDDKNMIYINALIIVIFTDKCNN